MSDIHDLIKQAQDEFRGRQENWIDRWVDWWREADFADLGMLTIIHIELCLVMAIQVTSIFLLVRWMVG